MGFGKLPRLISRKIVDFDRPYNAINVGSLTRELSGRKLNKKSLKFWEVMGSLKWGIMCLKMYDAYRSGYDTSVDRAAIGRRVSETEIDLLRLITNEEDNE